MCAEWLLKHECSVASTSQARWRGDRSRSFRLSDRRKFGPSTTISNKSFRLLRATSAYRIREALKEGPMNAKIALAVAMLFGSLAGGLIAGADSRPGVGYDDAMRDTMDLAMAQCAGGYHPDASGNCQPDYGIVDSRCPGGFEAAPAPNGNSYRCEAIPSGY